MQCFKIREILESGKEACTNPDGSLNIILKIIFCEFLKLNSSHMKKLILSFLISLTGFTTSSQSHPDLLFFKDRLQPLAQENIFKTEGYYNWCSSILKTNDGMFHLFYSRWPKKLGFNAWLTHSAVAHATSKNPLGPW